MIIMALDHVRDFFHSAAALHPPLDLQRTSVSLFLTRWITHFCAPTFVFLSGTSAFLTLGKKGKAGLSKFLFTRGVWLVIAELTVINFALNFLQVSSVLLLQTIWAIGISMIALSALIYLPKRLLLVIAFVIIAGHNVLDNIDVPGQNFKALLWSLFHQTGLFTYGNFHLIVGFPVLSWMGIMIAGFCFGELYTAYPHAKRKRILIVTGVLCIFVFIVLRSWNLYGDNQPWLQQKNTVFTFLSFIKTNKYPPSLLYTLGTLGPVILLLAFLEKPLNAITKIFAIYGRVPMFYYIMHLYFIRIAFIILAVIEGYHFNETLNRNLLAPLAEFGYKLTVVYLIWITIVILLYPLCKKYDAYKSSNRQKWWLSYL